MSLWAIIRNISAWARSPCLSRGKAHLDWCSFLICRWGPSSFDLGTDYFSSRPPGEDFTQTQPRLMSSFPHQPTTLISFTRAILYLVCRPDPMWENATFPSPVSARGQHLPTLLAHEGPAWHDIKTWQQTGSEKISSARISKMEATFVLGVFCLVNFFYHAGFSAGVDSMLYDVILPLRFTCLPWIHKCRIVCHYVLRTTAASVFCLQFFFLYWYMNYLTQN